MRKIKKPSFLLLIYEKTNSHVMKKVVDDVLLIPVEGTSEGLDKIYVTLIFL